MFCSPPGSSVHGESPGKSTGVDCHASSMFVNTSLYKLTVASEPRNIKETSKAGHDPRGLLGWAKSSVMPRWWWVRRSVTSASRNPTDCNPPGPSIHETFQARTPQWVAVSFSRGSSWPRDWTHASCIAHWWLFFLPEYRCRSTGLYFVCLCFKRRKRSIFLLCLCEIYF